MTTQNVQQEQENDQKKIESEAQGIQEPQKENNSVTAATAASNESFALDFDSWIKEKPRHKYVKLDVGVPKVLRFKNGKGEMHPTDMGGRLKEKIPAARYMITTPDEPNELIQIVVLLPKVTYLSGVTRERWVC